MVGSARGRDAHVKGGVERWKDSAPLHEGGSEGEGGMAELTVVIPTYGGATRLPLTLAALEAAAPNDAMEIIVVDDGSPAPIDGAALQRGPGRPLVLRSPANRGRAAACNAGVARASGRVVLVLDDDMTIAPGALAGHVAAHPAGGPVIAVVGRIAPAPASFRGRFGAFLVEEEARRRERLVAAAGRLSATDCLTGHFSIEREVLSAVGGYDESFTRYGFEDIELAWRLGQRGVRLVYRDDLVAIHRSAHASFATHCRRHRESGAMAAVFAARTPDASIRAFLRVDGMEAAQKSAFLRVMARAHRFARRTTGFPRELLLAVARLGVTTLAPALPRRHLHALYHVVRDMHYAAGIADGSTRASSA